MITPVSHEQYRPHGRTLIREGLYLLSNAITSLFQDEHKVTSDDLTANQLLIMWQSLDNKKQESTRVSQGLPVPLNLELLDNIKQDLEPTLKYFCKFHNVNMHYFEIMYNLQTEQTNEELIRKRYEDIYISGFNDIIYEYNNDIVFIVLLLRYRTNIYTSTLNIWKEHTKLVREVDDADWFHNVKYFERVQFEASEDNIRKEIEAESENIYFDFSCKSKLLGLIIKMSSSNSTPMSVIKDLTTNFRKVGSSDLISVHSNDDFITL